jgi:vitamin B12 transporter
VYFYRDIKDGLDYNYVTFQYFNFVRQKVQGLELETIIKPIDQITVKANYTLLTSDESTQSRQNFKDTSYTYLLRRPKHSVNMNVGYQPTKALYVSICAKYASDRFDTGGFMAPDVKLNSYFILNAYAEYAFNKYLKVFADAQNLTNKQFFEVNGYNAIPFMISGGITFTL